MIKKSSIIIGFLSVLFILFSFVPTFYEYSLKDKIPPGRYFILEHNYNFDYNFYLSRIREGTSGRWTVTEKYYNLPHKSSLFQIVYLYFGKIGGLFGLSVPVIYHSARFIFGLLLLLTVGWFGKYFFKGNRLILFFLLSVTDGSFPILLKIGNFYRSGTYMGWWSVIDSLQRLTIMPHILIGQALLVLLIGGFGNLTQMKWKILFLLSAVGLIAGIIFPPTVIIIYVYLMFMSIFAVLDILANSSNFAERRKKLFAFIINTGLRMAVFFVITIPGLLYLSVAFKEQPWKALSVFDIEHRFLMPYKEYALALGPVLILGAVGFVLAFYKSRRKYYSVISWILALIFLFLIFEKVPEQSPLRFTEGLINVPLAVLATYLLTELWKIRKLRIVTGLIIAATITSGILVMVSMIGWLTDQAYYKGQGTWPVPLGAQLAYPLNEFMNAIFYLRDNTKKDDVVLTYITAGNYIPAYSGNYVYIGHANTPFEDKKEPIAAEFFKGHMSTDAAEYFLKKERITYVFFGPQEKELGNLNDLKEKYPFLKSVYMNDRVIIYKTE